MAMPRDEFTIFNSMTGDKKVFKSHKPGKVGMYVCGVTPYALSHLGHARAAIAFDVLYRYLLHLGYEVTYVRNFTDVDDKIIDQANKCKENPMSLSSRYCDEYLKDMALLQCLTPTHQPRVSKHIDQVIAMITKIIDNGCAYTVEGDVFFEIEEFPEYGKLSGRKLEDNRAGERVSIDRRKRNPADFALWKAAKPGEPSWESPWGPGRPGWHIECSAMSAHYLSYSFDIHGGGIDLIFPHHENELALTCAACQESKVSYWLHNGHVTMNDAKMSKSDGNFHTIRKIIESYHPIALRHFLLSAQYRSQINYSSSQMDRASEAVFYIYQTLQDCENALAPFVEEISGETRPNSREPQITPDAQECIMKLRSEFHTKMSDDMQTPPILTSTILDALRFINSSLKKLGKQQSQQQLSTAKSLSEVSGEIKKVLNVLGLLTTSSYSEVLQQLKEKALRRAELTEDDISKLIEDRIQARENRDFALSDKIRTELTTKGISLMDLGKETTWRPCAAKSLDSSVIKFYSKNTRGKGLLVERSSKGTTYSLYTPMHHVCGTAQRPA